MKYIFKLFRLISVYRWPMLLATLLGFLTIGSSIGLLMTSAYIISKAALHPSVAELQVGIVGVRFFGITRGIFRYLERLISHDLTFKILSRIRVWFYKALEPLAPARLLYFRNADLLNRILNDIHTLEPFFIRVLAPALVAIFVSLLMWLLLGIFHPLFPLVLFAGHLLAGVVLPAISHLFTKGLASRIITIQAQLNQYILDGLQGLSELLVFNRADDHFNEIDHLGRKLVKTQQKLVFIEAAQESLTGLIMNLSIIGVLYLAIPFITDGRLDGLFLAVIALGVMASFEAIVPLAALPQALESAGKAGQRLFEIIDARSDISEPAIPSRPPERFDIELQDLLFTYNNDEQAALSNISMRFPFKSKTVIVGPSGSGKSTIINILLRFWEYQQGRALLDSKNIREYREEDIRGCFAVVSQKTHLFNGTIRDNLWQADGQNEEKIWQVLRIVQLEELIRQSSAQLDLYIGEQGVKLSSGQAQRLAIARALLHDTPILILDEATANLDMETEQKLMASVLKYCVDKTVIMITHRIAGLEQADMIYAMNNGCLEENGSHEQLMNKRGFYYRMQLAQNEVFQIAD